jgi:hypothetical protein
MTGQSQRVEVSRRIEAPPSRIFQVLADPQQHTQLDGSMMLRGSLSNQQITHAGDVFTMKMHRLGRDYLMINYVVTYERDRCIAWEPAPGDLDTAQGDPDKIGVPAGYRWGYVLTPANERATDVTEIFDCGSLDNRWIIDNEDGKWINGATSLVESMAASLERLEQLSTQ